MREHRFIGNFPADGETVSITDTEQARQITRVLRLKEGDTLVLSDGAGHEARASLSETDPVVRARILERWENAAEPERRITLFVATLRRDNFEWVLQKATEVGVAAIVPLATDRTVKAAFKHERAQKILHEAAEQSGRGMVPELREQRSFFDALNQAEGDAKVVFDSEGEWFEPEELHYQTADVFVGPEGGWSDEERASAREAGCTVASLGALTLRAETAATVASYRAVHRI